MVDHQPADVGHEPGWGSRAAILTAWFRRLVTGQDS